MSERRKILEKAHARVPAYAAFLDGGGVGPDAPWRDIPLTNKKNYLLAHKTSDLCWDGSLGKCHLIGSSSGFSKTGSLFWPKRPADEAAYMEGVESMLIDHYAIDRKRTLALVCLAFGTWIGGIQLATCLRTLAASGRHPLTAATPGLHLSEAVDIFAAFGHEFDQSLWITNVSNVSLIAALMDQKGVNPPPASAFFPVVGEYYPEDLRLWAARRFGHMPEEPFCMWTGYGSADTGDLGVETRETIALRKFIHAEPGLSERIFGSANTPMLLAASPKAHLEIAGGNIVATKDQLIPLVRYDTGDSGSLISRDQLLATPGVPGELARAQPELIVCVSGRASDAVVFYGTNLMMGDVQSHLLALPPEMGYAGVFKLAQEDEGGVSVFLFKVYVSGAKGEGRRQEYQKGLLDFLCGQSLEFKSKYQALAASMGRELIEVELLDAADRPREIKHKYIVE